MLLQVLLRRDWTDKGKNIYKTPGTTETFPPDITKQCETSGTTEHFHRLLQNSVGIKPKQIVLC